MIFFFIDLLKEKWALDLIVTKKEADKLKSC